MPVHLLATLQILLATAVTLHALLTKRDVRAAVGWIGLAWLAPVAGAVLYWLLGINRVTWRARPVLRGHAAPAAPALAPANLGALALAVERVTGRPLTGGNSVRALRGGREAYPAMLEAIGGARRTLALATYLFRADPVGDEFVAALTAAHRRGVAVRVLIDGVGGGFLRSAPARALHRSGVPVARFLPPVAPWRIPLLNMRNHRKLLVVDGALAFTGGMNIGAENVGASRCHRPVDDVHFRVEGPVVAQLLAVFAQDWEFSAGETLGESVWPAAAPAAGTVPARAITSGPDADLDRRALALLAALGEARARVRIVTPYLLPDSRLLSALQLAAMRGVIVQIVLPAHSNRPAVDWAAAAQLGLLVGAGCRVARTPAPFDHAKLMTVDGAWSLVGSGNWDDRSLRLNFELDLEVYDAAVAEAVDRLIDSRLDRAVPVGSAELARRAWPVKLRDAAARLLLPYL